MGGTVPDEVREVVMHSYRLIYGFDFVLENPKVVGEHEIVAKSMRSAMYKANALMKELGNYLVFPNNIRVLQDKIEPVN